MGILFIWCSGNALSYKGRQITIGLACGTARLGTPLPGSVQLKVRVLKCDTCTQKLVQGRSCIQLGSAKLCPSQLGSARLGSAAAAPLNFPPLSDGGTL